MIRVSDANFEVLPSLLKVRMHGFAKERLRDYEIGKNLVLILQYNRYLRRLFGEMA